MGEIIQIDKKLQKIVNNTINEECFPLEISYNINGIDVKGFGIYNSKEPEENNNRYYLELNIQNMTGKTLITIMMNPSTTFPNTSIDKTVKNVIRIAKAVNCSKVIILNTISIINSNVKEAIKKQEEDKKEDNKNFVLEYLKLCSKENTIFLAAWGANNNINRYNCYKDEIRQWENSNIHKNKVFAYSINIISKTPAHPNGRGGNNAYILNHVLSNTANLIPININDDLTCINIKNN